MSTHAAAARAQCLELFSLVLSGQCCGLRMPRTRAARPTARTALSACASTLDYAVLYDNREIQSLVVRTISIREIGRFGYNARYAGSQICGET